MFAAQLFCTFAMTGVIWFVQLVHYPLFALVQNPHHAGYASQHQTRTGWVVAPLMLLELLTSFLLLWPRFRPPTLTPSMAITGLALLAIIWLSTIALQIPQHTMLLSGAEPKAIQKLVTTNWIRTAAWTLRSAILLYALLR